MSKHAALDTFGRSGNPVIRSSAFDSRASSDSERMTLDGAVNKTAIMLAILISTAAISWNFPSPFIVMLSYIGILGFNHFSFPSGDIHLPDAFLA